MFRSCGEARNAGFSFIEVMITTAVVVIGLLAVASSTATTSLLRKQGIQEDTVFYGLSSRMEWVRGQLFANTPLQNGVEQSLAAGPSHVETFQLDVDGDGTQDVSFTAGDQNTPVISVTIEVPDPPGDPNVLLQATVTANWYGAGGNNTRSISSLIANRTGYGD